MNIIINPGTGPVPESDVNAAANMVAFVRDLSAWSGVSVEKYERNIDADDGEGRFGFDVTTEHATHEVQMPGLSIDQVRFFRNTGQDPWDFPRLYVDGSSWLWAFALDMFNPDDE